MNCPICDDTEFVDVRVVRVHLPTELYALCGDDDDEGIARGPIVPYRCSRDHVFYVQAKDVTP